MGADGFRVPFEARRVVEARELPLALAQEIAQRRLDQVGLGQAREVREVADESAKRTDLLLDDLERRVEQVAEPRVVAGILPVTLLHGELDRRERVLDLVGEPLRHLLPLPHALQKLDAGAGLDHFAEHAIERRREIGQLVGAGDRGAHREIPLGDEVDRRDEAVDAGGHAAREQRAEDERDEHRDAEQHRERVEIALVKLGARSLERVVFPQHRAARLEAVEQVTVEREGGDEVPAAPFHGAPLLEAPLRALVDGAAAVLSGEHDAVVGLHAELDELGKTRKKPRDGLLRARRVFVADGVSQLLVGGDRVRLVAHVVFDRPDVLLVELDSTVELLADLRDEPNGGRLPEKRAGEHERCRERHHGGEQDRQREPLLRFAGNSPRHARSLRTSELVHYLPCTFRARASWG